MTTTTHKNEIEVTRVGGFGGSDANLFYRVGLRGLSALNNTDKKRIRVAKGMDEYKSIPMTDAMQRGHDFEDFYEMSESTSLMSREVLFSAELAKNFKTFFHADFADKMYVYELKCVQNPDNVEKDYEAQLQWQAMVSGMKVCLVVCDSVKRFEDYNEPIEIIRDENVISILKNGIRLIDENWETLDLNVGEEWRESDLMPFEKKDVELLSGALREIKRLKAQAKKFKEQLLEFMQSNNIQTLKSDEYSITYVPESVKITLDKKKLFSEHPKIKEQDYIKTSPKKAYLDITLKNLKN